MSQGKQRGTKMSHEEREEATEEATRSQGDQEAWLLWPLLAPHVSTWPLTVCKPWCKPCPKCIKNQSGRVNRPFY